MTRTPLRGAGSLVLALTAALAATATAVGASPADDGKLLVLTSPRYGWGDPFDLGLLNPDGGDRVMLTNNGGYARADGSPDGRRIAFATASTRPLGSEDSEIFVMNADGSERVQLTSDDVDDYSPAWSPDGRRIAFSSNGYIVVMDADGSGHTRLTDGGEPAWSPDGRRIAFNGSTADGLPRIFVMNADGRARTQLTNEWSSGAEWSPDGHTIAYTTWRKVWNGVKYQLYGDIAVVSADGGPSKQLTHLVQPISKGPHWSPDGRKIAFSGNPGAEQYEAFVMNADGSGQTRITNNRGEDDVVDWMPTPPAPGSPGPAPRSPGPTPVVRDTLAPAMAISRRAVRMTRAGIVAVRLRCPGRRVCGLRGPALAADDLARPSQPQASAEGRSRLGVVPHPGREDRRGERPALPCRPPRIESTPTAASHRHRSRGRPGWERRRR
jgi:dipeptidyl aminopeptidase/acylaminoacyl peptidase